jgi:cullin 1
MAVILRGASGLMDESLLAFYHKEWLRFTAALRFVNHIFSYLNRHWIKREAEDGKKEVYEVNILGLVVWRDHLFREVKSRLTKALLDQIERDRNGEQINSQLVAGVIEGYVRLGLNRERPKELTLDVYREDFETPFLAETQNFYARESALFVAENSVSDYLKKVLARLAQEVKRGVTFAHQSSHASLMSVCEKAMIEKHVPTIQNEAAGFFAADKVEDLGNLYQLLVRVPTALDPVRLLCEKHIHTMGMTELESVAKVFFFFFGFVLRFFFFFFFFFDEFSEKEKDKDQVVKPQAYVEAVLRVWRKFEKKKKIGWF